MKKKLIIGICLMLVSVGCLSGCTESLTRPSLPDSDYGERFSDVEVQVDSFLFDFSEVVLENGSVMNATDEAISIRMVNYGNISARHVKFEIQQIPPELQVWTTIVFCDNDNVTHYLYKKGKINKCIISEIVPAEGEISVDIRIRFDNASEWTYKNDELYTVILKCSWEGRIEKHCSQGNTYHRWEYEEITIPLKVRT